MKRLLFLFLLLPFAASAQLKPYFDMWEEADVIKHTLFSITYNKGKVSDSCGSVFPPETKTIYIVKEPYFKRMSDTMNGYNLVYINPDSNTRELYKVQQETKVPILYLSYAFNYLEFYHVWVIPIKMKKKKPEYQKRGYKFHYYFQHNTATYDFTKIECESWE